MNESPVREPHHKKRSPRKEPPTQEPPKEEPPVREPPRKEPPEEQEPPMKLRRGLRCFNPPAFDQIDPDVVPDQCHEQDDAHRNKNRPHEGTF